MNTQLDQPAKWDHAIRYCPLLSEERKYKHLDLYLADSGEGAVGSIRAILVRESPAAKTIHGVGGDGVAELLEGVVPVPALFDLMEQFGQLTCHSIIWRERLGTVKNATKILERKECITSAAQEKSLFSPPLQRCSEVINVSADCHSEREREWICRSQALCNIIFRTQGAALHRESVRL